MKVFIAQLNPTVGALDTNRLAIEAAYRDGVAAGAHIVVVPELAVTGYPPRDLLEKREFIDAALATRDRLASATGETALVFGCIARTDKACGRPLRNVAAVARAGKIVYEQAKSLLPTYDVFDELRYFEPADAAHTIELFGERVAISICEDFWFEQDVAGLPRYCTNPLDELLGRGCDLVINLSASPFNVGKRKTRYELFRRIARKHRVPIVYVNQVGGNDELLFDGSSIVLGADGETVFCAAAFETDASLVPLAGPACDGTGMNAEEQIGRALTLGVRDYVRKCGFRDVVIGLSGGIDSAVTAAVAVEALGPEHVTGIAMPSPFSSEGSVRDARALAEALAIPLHLEPIDAIYAAFANRFHHLFSDDIFDVTHENVQARIRGALLMAWSNRRGALLLSTGNKSELAVGYCTLYGDMAGGLDVLGDVYKTSVYDVARWLNRNGKMIPVATIEKPPSAELRPNQTDQDSLPPYEVLDGILKLYIEEWREVEEVVAAGFDRTLVERIVRLVDTNEFKRSQAAPAIRVSTKAFGSGRQMPIAQQWRRDRSTIYG